MSAKLNPYTFVERSVPKTDISSGGIRFPVAIPQECFPDNIHTLPIDEDMILSQKCYGDGSTHLTNLIITKVQLVDGENTIDAQAVAHEWTKYDDTVTVRISCMPLPPSFQFKNNCKGEHIFAALGWQVMVDEGRLLSYEQGLYGEDDVIEIASAPHTDYTSFYDFSLQHTGKRRGVDSLVKSKGWCNQGWVDGILSTPGQEKTDSPTFIPAEPFELWTTLKDFSEVLSMNFYDDERKVNTMGVTEFFTALQFYKNLVVSVETNEPMRLEMGSDDKPFVQYGDLHHIWSYSWPTNNDDYYQWWKRGSIKMEPSYLHVPCSDRTWDWSPDESESLKKRGVFKFWQSLCRLSYEYDDISETDEEPQPLYDRTATPILDEPDRIPFVRSGSDRRTTLLLTAGEWSGSTPVIDRFLNCGWCNGRVRLIIHTQKNFPEEPLVCPHCGHGEFEIQGGK